MNTSVVLSLMLTAAILTFIAAIVKVSVKYQKRKPGEPWIKIDIDKEDK